MIWKIIKWSCHTMQKGGVLYHRHQSTLPGGGSMLGQRRRRWANIESQWIALPPATQSSTRCSLLMARKQRNVFFSVLSYPFNISGRLYSSDPHLEAWILYLEGNKHRTHIPPFLGSSPDLIWHFWMLLVADIHRLVSSFQFRFIRYIIIWLFLIFHNLSSLFQMSWVIFW